MDTPISQNGSLKVLLLDDVHTDSELVDRALRKGGLDIESEYVSDRDSFAKSLQSYQPDIVLSDFNMPNFTGLDAVNLVKDTAPDTPIIIVTGAIDEETAADCIKAGAWDYVLKDNLSRLPSAVTSSMELKQAKTERQLAQKALDNYREYARNLVNSSLDMIIAVDTEGLLTEFNQAAQKELGYTRQEVIGKRVRMLLKDTSRAPSIDVLLEQEGEFIEEYEFQRKDGSTFSVLLSASQLKDSSGEIIGSMGVCKDISDLKQAEQKIRKSEERFRTIYNNAPDAYYINDLKGNFIDGNFAAERMIGQTKNDILGKNFFKTGLLNAKQLPRAAKLLALNAMGKPTGPDEFTLHREDGSTVEVEISTYPVEIDDQKLVLGNARDITERVQYESELRESEQRYRAVTESAVDAIISVGGNGRILAWNKAAEDMFQFTGSEVIGQSFDNIVPENRVGDHKKTLERYLKGENPSMIGQLTELEGRRKDGSHFPMELTLSTWQLHGERYFTAIVRDISERKIAENSLRESEEKYRLIVENAHDGIEISQDDKIVFSNPRFAEMLGYEVHEIQGLNFSDIFTPESTQEMMERFEARSSSGEEPGLYEAKFFKKDGSTIDVHVRYEITDFLGKTATFAMIRDITEQKKADFEIHQALEKAQEGERVKTMFMANVSHEIRTPLNSILGFSELLEAQLGERLREDEKEFIKHLKRNGNRLMQTVDGILNISQIEAKSIQTNPSEIELDRLMQRLGEEYKIHAQEKDLEFQLTCNTEDEVVFLDEYILTQTLTNLLDNAIKYTDSGSIGMELIRKNDQLSLNIIDTGVGMSEEYQNRMFNPFSQESEGFNKTYQGIGLGLALVKRYTELSGISLSVESEKDSGTRITLVFPTKDRIS